MDLDGSCSRGRETAAPVTDHLAHRQADSDDDPGEPKADASAFASRLAGPASVQVAQPEAQPPPTWNRREGVFRPSIRTSRPILFPDDVAIADRAPSRSELPRPLRSLTGRDAAILQALRDWRYLDVRQATALFFPSERAAQMRIQVLRALGLVHRWKMAEPPGLTRRPSLLMLSRRGAIILAAIHGEPAAPYVERSRQAQAYCWRAPHDLEANDFFIWLALESAKLSDAGLLSWCGEETMRAQYRTGGGKRKEDTPTPDGYGMLLTPAGRVDFDLEWDRGTESWRRLGRKARAQAEWRKGWLGAELHHVLFVVPAEARERRLLAEIAGVVGHLKHDIYSRKTCCSFWTTTRERLWRAGPLGAIWAAPPPPPEDSFVNVPAPDPATLPRVALAGLPHKNTGAEDLRGCIGKPRWWELRPAGGEALP